MILGYVLLMTNKPERYREEAAVMERIAALLDSPVVHERFVGPGWAPYVTFVFLPSVELDEMKTRELGQLLRELPKVESVSAYYVRDQKERVEQLRREIAPIDIAESLWASSRDSESRQKDTYVAGVHPDRAR